VDFSATVIRPEDHLVLELDFRGVDFTPPTAGQPGEVRGAAGAFLIARFQPQHISEQAFYQASEELAQPGESNADDIPAPPGAVQSRLAGPSRLAFSLPAGVKFSYTLEGVLDALGRLPLSVDPVSAYNPDRTGCLPIDLLLKFLNVPPPPHVAPPTDTQTAIEVPYRLILSPDDFGLWWHTTAPVTHAGWTELWHTQLRSRRSADPRVRAIWSPDFDPNRVLPEFDPVNPTEADPFRASVSARDRNDLVHLTSNHYLRGFIPSPVETERFILSTLGATLTVQGDWDPTVIERHPKISLTQWRHDAAIGRDQYVRVVRLGYLMPFGHRATLVKVTERKFYHVEGGKNPGFVAYLFQRNFIVVKEFERSYAHRSMPFRTIQIRTRITPNLAKPEDHGLMGPGKLAFWPYVVRPPDPEDKPFYFDVVGVDWEGRSIPFGTPLAFVDDTAEQDTNGAVNGYNAGILDLRQPGLGGQPMAFAPPGKPGDTTFDAASVTFQTEIRSGDPPRFQPKVQEASVTIPAVKQITGGPGQSTIGWEPTYLAGSGDAIGNAAGLFATVKDSPLDFGSTERSGGLVAPDLTISGLSRSLGPVGGAASAMVGGTFDPELIFGDGVKLLGGITLKQIVNLLQFTDAGNVGGKLPKLVTEQFPNRLETTYSWQLSKAELRTTDLFIPGDNSTFRLEATVQKKLDTTEPKFTVEGGLTDFKVKLLPKTATTPDAVELVQLEIASVTFKAERGKKVDVSVQLGKIEFLGILAFVNRLQEFIPLDAFNDPPNLRVVTTPNPGVDVGFSLGIPTIGLGIMTMQNVSLGASVYLPFGDAPLNFHFAFCERQQPFILTVSLFGGGGFFAMDVGVDKVVMVEAALEFGASIALNLGVAQGQASIMAGFYFQKAGDKFTLTGYFRASGSLSVIGIITVSLVFYLGLSYESKGLGEHAGTLWGQATLTVKIEILFFSTSVGVSMEREFAGTDPTFRELIPPKAWTEYCDAFASYA
jgi:hypothetical protein